MSNDDEFHLKRLSSHVTGLIESKSNKCLVVAGPGAGKTTSFKKVLEANGLPKNKSLVVTFLGGLKKDLEKDLGGPDPKICTPILYIINNINNIQAYENSQNSSRFKRANNWSY